MPHPWLSRHVVYPLQERLLERPTFAYLESLEQSVNRRSLHGQWWALPIDNVINVSFKPRSGNRNLLR